MSFNAQALRDAGMDPEVVLKIERARRCVMDLVMRDVPLSVSYSGGKDSSVVLLLTVQAYRDAVERLRAQDPGRWPWPLIVVSASTGIENPVIESYLAGQLARLAAYAAAHALDVRARIAMPTPASTWQVGVVGGRRLPTFAQSSSRDCTIDFKVKPMRRLLAAEAGSLAAEARARALGAPSEAGDRLEAMAADLDARGFVSLVGTRFDESASRARRMAARGDAAGVVGGDGKGRRTLPLIADFTTDDVWETLAFAGQGPERPLEAFAPDFDETRDVYREATGECVVIAEEKRQAAACGARFGCALCTVSGSTDRSMETLIAQPRHAHLAPLNRLRNFLVASRGDLSRRRWVARTADPVTGWVRLLPDVYAPAMCEELLGMMLTIDALERERARRMGLSLVLLDGGEDPHWPEGHMRETAASGAPDLEWARRMARPQFELVAPETLILIDFLWARYGGHRPFRALWLWREVARRGRRWPVPEIAPAGVPVLPEARWANPGRAEREWGPLFDPLVHALMEAPGADLPPVSRRSRMAMRHEPIYSVDPESAGFVLEFEADRLIEEHHDQGSGPLAAVHFYLRYGAVAVPARDVGGLEAILTHAVDLADAGLAAGEPVERLLEGSISQAEHDALRRSAATGRRSGAPVAARRRYPGGAPASGPA